MKNKLTSFACSALIFLPLGCISAQARPTLKDCQAYGDTLVTNSGSALAEIGESPVDIRRTVDYYCMLGFRAASEAKSQSEIELWRKASMRGLSGINANRDQYKADVINHVAKIAEDFYKEKSVTDGAGE